MKFLILNDTNDERYEIDVADETAARHWVINHLNVSLHWCIHQVPDDRTGGTRGGTDGDLG